jgi:hypothetical protein
MQNHEQWYFRDFLDILTPFLSIQPAAVISFFLNATDVSTEWQSKVLEDKQFITDSLSYASEYKGAWTIFYNTSQHPGLLLWLLFNYFNGHFLLFYFILFFSFISFIFLFFYLLYTLRCKGAHTKYGFPRSKESKFPNVH